MAKGSEWHCTINSFRNSSSYWQIGIRKEICNSDHHLNSNIKINSKNP